MELSLETLNANSESPTKSNKRRAVKTYYHFDSTYENRESALLIINDDFYRCNRKCYLLYTLNDESISLWFNDFF